MYKNSIVFAGVCVLLAHAFAHAESSGQHWAKTKRAALANATSMSKTRCENNMPAEVKENCHFNVKGKPKTWDSAADKTILWMCALNFQCVTDPERAERAREAASKK